jgi:hypothetical protein
MNLVAFAFVSAVLLVPYSLSVTSPDIFSIVLSDGIFDINVEFDRAVNLDDQITAKCESDFFLKIFQDDCSFKLKNLYHFLDISSIKRFRIKVGISNFYDILLRNPFDEVEWERETEWLSSHPVLAGSINREALASAMMNLKSTLTEEVLTGTTHLLAH